MAIKRLHALKEYSKDHHHALLLCWKIQVGFSKGIAVGRIKAQLAGETIDKSKTKRKKDGVFYTPKYITKYIVENTVGKLCEEKRPLAPKGGIAP
ncbi:MAG: hypothetical protein PHW92_08950 [Lutibacter sp.]|nr:hypothetical protein [Lutibacter sp.]